MAGKAQHKLLTRTMPAAHIVECAIANAFRHEAVTVIVNAPGHRVTYDTLVGMPADLLALTLHHTLAHRDSSLRLQKTCRILFSCVMVSDKEVTDIVLATQLRQSDPALSGCEAVGLATCALRDWRGTEIRQDVQSLIDATRTVKAAQALLCDESLDAFWVSQRRVHTLVQLHLDFTSTGLGVAPPRSACVRLLGLTGVPGVCLREALQQAHSPQDTRKDCVPPAPSHFGEGLWYLLQPIPDDVHRVWQVVFPPLEPGQPIRNDWRMQVIFNHTPHNWRARLDLHEEENEDDRCNAGGEGVMMSKVPQYVGMQSESKHCFGVIAPTTPRSLHTNDMDTPDLRRDSARDFSDPRPTHGACEDPLPHSHSDSSALPSVASCHSSEAGFVVAESDDASLASLDAAEQQKHSVASAEKKQGLHLQLEAYMRDDSSIQQAVDVSLPLSAPHVTCNVISLRGGGRMDNLTMKEHALVSEHKAALFDVSQREVVQQLAQHADAMDAERPQPDTLEELQSTSVFFQSPSLQSSPTKTGVPHNLRTDATNVADVCASIKKCGFLDTAESPGRGKDLFSTSHPEEEDVLTADALDVFLPAPPVKVAADEEEAGSESGDDWDMCFSMQPEQLKAIHMLVRYNEVLEPSPTAGRRKSQPGEDVSSSSPGRTGLSLDGRCGAYPHGDDNKSY